MAQFREEVSELQQQSRQENETLLKTLMLHQQQSESLRQEARLMRGMTRPLLRRILDALGLGK